MTAMLMLATAQLTLAVPDLAGRDVRAVEVTRDGVVWFAVRDGGVARWASERLEWVADVPLDGVADLYEDTRGVLWAAGLGGAASWDGRAWRHLPDPGGLGSRVVFRVSQEPGEAGALWFAGTAGAARLEDGRWETVTDRDGLPHAVVHAVLVDRDGTRWFACRRGLARMDERGVTTFEPDTNFRSAVEAADGTIWFGTSSGFRFWAEEGLTTTEGGGVVYPVLRARDGTLWSGSVGLGVLRYVDATWRAVAGPSELGDAEVYDLAQGPSGVIWVASSAGVFSSSRDRTAPGTADGTRVPSSGAPGSTAARARR